MCDCDYHRSLDIVTPRNAFLSAYYKRSFAFYSIKHREPTILTQIIDSLVRNKEQIGNQLGPDAPEELKQVIGDISKLKYEIQTNKPLYKLTGSGNDVEHYNNYIEKWASEDGRVTHFHTVWLLAECYMYRRLRDAFISRNSFKNFDYFFDHKKDAYNSAEALMIQLGTFILSVTEDNDTDTEGSLRRDLTTLLKINLWGNKCDLSLTLGVVEGSQNDFDTSAYEEFILVNNSEDVFEVVYNKNEAEASSIIDIVMDNSGYEIFTDLCLADYLISKNLIRTIRFHVKSFPWFISDVTRNDFQWVLSQLQRSEHEVLKEVGQRWNKLYNSNMWRVEDHEFWTYPHEFMHMSSLAPDLYRKLAESRLILFKGDLNYRKLLGEKNWDPTTPFETALQDFNPSKLCSLRTVKAHLICGLEPGVAENLDIKDPKWMETGNYGLIQYSNKIVKLEEEAEVNPES